MTASLQFEAFGQSDGTSPTRYQFTGRERDDATGLLYYRTRWYDPATMRFNAEDIIGFEGGLNLYTYVGNAPVQYKDPFGTDGGVLTLPAAGAAAAGGAAAAVAGGVVVIAVLWYGSWKLGEWIADQPWNPLTHPTIPPYTMPQPSGPNPASPGSPRPPNAIPGSPAAPAPSIPIPPGQRVPYPPPPPMPMAKGGKQNKSNEWSDEARRRFGSNKDAMCKWLAEQYKCATDSATKWKIGLAQKVLGCRHKGMGVVVRLQYKAFGQSSGAPLLIGFQQA